MISNRPHTSHSLASLSRNEYKSIVPTHPEDVTQTDLGDGERNRSHSFKSPGRRTFEAAFDRTTTRYTRANIRIMALKTTTRRKKNNYNMPNGDFNRCRNQVFDLFYGRPVVVTTPRAIINAHTWTFVNDVNMKIFLAVNLANKRRVPRWNIGSAHVVSW